MLHRAHTHMRAMQAARRRTAAQRQQPHMLAPAPLLGNPSSTVHSPRTCSPVNGKNNDFEDETWQRMWRDRCRFRYRRKEQRQVTATLPMIFPAVPSASRRRQRRQRALIEGNLPLHPDLASSLTLAAAHERHEHHNPPHHHPPPLVFHVK